MVPAGAAEAKKALAQQPRMVLIGQPLGMYAPNFFPEKAGRDLRAEPLLESAAGQSRSVHGLLRHVASLRGGALRGGRHFHRRADGVHPRERHQEWHLARPGSRVAYRQPDALFLAHPRRRRRGVEPARRPHSARDSARCRCSSKLFIAGTAEEEARELQRVKDGQSILDDVGDQIKAINRKVSSHDPRAARSIPHLRARGRADACSRTSTGARRRSRKSIFPRRRASSAGRNCSSARANGTTSSISPCRPTPRASSPLARVAGAAGDSGRHARPPRRLASRPGPGEARAARLIEEAEIQMLGEFIEKMKASKEGDHTLLDKTAIFYTSNLGNSSSHDNNNLPICSPAAASSTRATSPSTRRTTRCSRTSSCACSTTWAWRRRPSARARAW